MELAACYADFNYNSVAEYTECHGHFSGPERLADFCANSKHKRKYTLFRIPEPESDK